MDMLHLRFALLSLVVAMLKTDRFLFVSLLEANFEDFSGFFLCASLGKDHGLVFFI